MKPRIISYLNLIVVFYFISFVSFCQEKPKPMNKLSPEEEKIIIHKGTEMPFSGKYYKYNHEGTYICKRCDAPLYQSKDKFDSNCGWPSFDDEISGAIKRTIDNDGIRTEITCANCGAHLGHVFTGEKFTPKNTRHCVNSISLNFTPSIQNSDTNIAIFAGGCFWGVEYYMLKQKGVISVVSGYTGGDTKNPTYKEVCTGNTGHAEAVKITFDKTKTDFETLAKIFFEIHDPTQINRQGPDVGTQYRSSIFYLDENQKVIAIKLIDILKNKGYNIVTQVEKYNIFYPAEDYHQNYYQNKGSLPYCHKYEKKF